MIVTVFRSSLLPEARDDYLALLGRMVELAASMPGYISHKGYTAEDGERCTIVEFDSEEAQLAWRMHPEHRAAQHAARENYYQSFNLQICEMKRQSKFDRDAPAAAAE